MTIGSAATNLIATAASAVLTAVSAVVTVQSFLALQEVRRNDDEPG